MSVLPGRAGDKCRSSSHGGSVTVRAMPLDLKAMLEPSRCAVVTSELQNGVIGPSALFPELARLAGRRLEAMAVVVDAARAAGVPVVHATVHRRADARGANTNAGVFGAALKRAREADFEDLLPGSAAAAVVDRIGLAETDIVLPRYHGLGPMHDTGLAAVLRNLGVRTVVPVGVSVNVAITNLVMDAVNAGFAVVLPGDAVAGVPEEYAESVIANTLSLLAVVVPAREIAGLWGVQPPS
ncbi:cysteine hydrolase [Catenulispora yoronensis]|uniref:Cysteine hydrolase n=2 Tax=Catenulispora yoronensis TaxID=450799 RepID=A0ABN2TS43_9ACTN